jgi:hypothetical protein
MTDTQATAPVVVSPCPHCAGTGQIPRAQRVYGTEGGGYRGPLVEVDGFTLTPAMAETLDLVRQGVSTPAEIAERRRVQPTSAAQQLRTLVEDGWIWSPTAGVYRPLPEQTAEVTS